MQRVTDDPRLRRFLADESGATAIEYALIASGVAGAIIVTVQMLGGNLAALWTSVSGAFG
jgi:pilus assembly protein Flp/PilA